MGFEFEKLSWLFMTISLNTTNQVVPATNHQTYQHSGQLTNWLKISINGIHNSTKYRLYFPVPAVLLNTNIACYFYYSLFTTTSTPGQHGVIKNILFSFKLIFSHMAFYDLLLGKVQIKTDHQVSLKQMHFFWHIPISMVFLQLDDLVCFCTHKKSPIEVVIRLSYLISKLVRAT